MLKIRKIAGNADGRFFTTDCCISCDACRVLAPKNFVELKDGLYVVKKQPETEEELAAVLEVYRSILEPNGPGPCIIDREDPKNIPDYLDDGTS